jgi:glycerol-3-phosphate dehydrogenase
VYAATDEWAYDVDDVLRRRTTVEVRGLATPAVRADVAKRLATTPVPQLSDRRRAWRGRRTRRRQVAGA